MTNEDFRERVRAIIEADRDLLDRLGEVGDTDGVAQQPDECPMTREVNCDHPFCDCFPPE